VPAGISGSKDRGLAIFDAGDYERAGINWIDRERDYLCCAMMSLGAREKLSGRPADAG
jgi:hypothetical protein